MKVIINVMNTWADESKGVLDPDEIWLGLVWNILFAGHASVIANPILCNPATGLWLKDDDKCESLKKWSQAGLFTVFTYHKNPTLVSYAKDLILYEGCGPKSLGPDCNKKLLAHAKGLDDLLKGIGIETLGDKNDRDEIDKFKTKVSKKIALNIERVHPALGTQRIRKILEMEMDRKLNEPGGVLTGTFWNSLPEKHPKELGRHANHFHQIEDTVFDFAHGMYKRVPLFGSPYYADIAATLGVADKFTRRGEIDVTPKLFLEAEVPATWFNKDELSNVRTEQLIEIARNEPSRKDYLTALKKVHQYCSVDTAMEAFETLRDYLGSLEHYLDTKRREKFSNDFDKLKRLKIRLTILQNANSALVPLEMGLCGEAGGVTSLQYYLPAVMLLAGACLLETARHKIKKRIDHLSQEVIRNMESLSKSTSPLPYILGQNIDPDRLNEDI